MINLLSSGSVPAWIVSSFPIIRICLVAAIAVASVLMIIAILVQPPVDGPQSTAITGGSQDSYFNRNSGVNNEGRLKILTIVCACIIAICAILYFVTYAIYQGGF